MQNTNDNADGSSLIPVVNEPADHENSLEFQERQLAFNIRQNAYLRDEVTVKRDHIFFKTPSATGPTATQTVN